MQKEGDPAATEGGRVAYNNIKRSVSSVDCCYYSSSSSHSRSSKAGSILKRLLDSMPEAPVSHSERVSAKRVSVLKATVSASGAIYFFIVVFTL